MQNLGNTHQISFNVGLFQTKFVKNSCPFISKKRNIYIIDFSNGDINATFKKYCWYDWKRLSVFLTTFDKHCRWYITNQRFNALVYASSHAHKAIHSVDQYHISLIYMHCKLMQKAGHGIVGSMLELLTIVLCRVFVQVFESQIPWKLYSVSLNKQFFTQWKGRLRLIQRPCAEEGQPL